MEPTRVRTRTRQRLKPGTVTKTVTKKEGGETVLNTSVTDHFPGSEHPNPAYVSVTGGLTKNLGDYNSVKIGVMVSIPCNPSEQGIRVAFDKASELVDEFVAIQLENATTP